jgi:hypothetical protein
LVVEILQLELVGLSRHAPFPFPGPDAPGDVAARRYTPRVDY